METIVQTKTSINCNNNKKTSQLSSISFMLEYEIDNTLNTIKENSHLLNKMIHQHQEESTETNVNDNSMKLTSPLKISEINNNDKEKETTDKGENSDVKMTKIGKQQQQQQQQQQDEIGNVDSANHQLKTNARKRWKILAKVLRKDSSEESVQSSSLESYSGSGGSCDDDETTIASVRRFKSFDLLRQDSFEDTTEINILSKPENWYTYKMNLDDDEYSVNIHHIERHLTAIDLMGFNNTGNICVWPSEEALTVYVLSNLHMFNNKWILELGGGMTCLAGLMLAKYSNAYLIYLTDGNDISMENVRRTICLNKLSCYTKSSVLKWEECTKRLNTDYEKFDFILSADCLFFDDARLSLIDTIWYYLSPQNGIALIMAPKRGKTLKIFIDECIKKGFHYQIIQKYNDIIWKRHLELKQQSKNLYDEDIHYPILIKLTKLVPNATISRKLSGATNSDI